MKERKLIKCDILKKYTGSTELHNKDLKVLSGGWLQLRCPMPLIPPRIEAIDIRHYAPNVYNSSLTVVRECSGVMKDQRYFLADTCREIQKNEV